jgi:phospholipase/carboxylesterase
MNTVAQSSEPADLECVIHETGSAPTASVIWLHGLGADGNDFSPIVPELDLIGCPPIRFVFPHAPVMAVTINNGYRMRAWYDILGANLVLREDENGIRASAVMIETLIAKELQRGVATSNIVLAGFSQGCAMALYTGVRHAAPLAGIIGLSGYLPLAGRTEAERSQANAATPIFLAHGNTDPVVPIQRALDSRAVLEKLGYRLQWQTYPMPHSVHPDEIKAVSAFLRSVLKIA